MDSASSAEASCAACGRGGDGLKKCAACKSVRYCGPACQKAHRSEHKQRCRELHDEALFREGASEMGDCPICFLPIPWLPSDSQLMSCCSKVICNGCFVQAIEVGEQKGLCAFCKGIMPDEDEDILERSRKRMAAGDHRAHYFVGHQYFNGRLGLPRDEKKAFEIWTQAAKLGSMSAHNNIGSMYHRGIYVQQDRKKNKHHWEIAATGGHAEARLNLGVLEVNAGNTDRAMRHFMIAAKMGLDEGLEFVSKGYREGNVTKEEFERTLRAHNDTADEMSSKEREDAKEKIASGLIY